MSFLLFLHILLPMLVTNSHRNGRPVLLQIYLSSGCFRRVLYCYLLEMLLSVLRWVFFFLQVNMILIAVIVLMILFYRPFCKWICPLGAPTHYLTRSACSKSPADSSKCVGCGHRSKACKMDVDVCKTPDHPECIRCGACIKALVRRTPSATGLWENQYAKMTTDSY